MRILSLDCELGFPEEDSNEFRSDVSLFDYDLVVWDAQNTRDTYETYAQFEGYPSLSPADSAAIRRDCVRRRREFVEFLELGRTVVIFSPGDVRVFADTGERSYSGTGKNRQTTRIVDGFDLWEAAAPMPVALEVGSGASIAAAGNEAAALLSATRSSWSYRATLTDLAEGLSPLFYVLGTKKVVGALARNSGDGLLVILPDYVPDEKDVETHNAALLEWISDLTGSPDARQPGWAANFLFGTEVSRIGRRQAAEAEAARIEQELELLRVEQAADDQWKLLVTGTGTALERQVEKALSVLGFEVERHDVGRSDLRGSWKDARVVVEVKGVAKSAAEKHAAQLEKWVSAELAEARQAKGILVVNSWRETPLDARTEPTFPDQMVPYSVQRDHCLVTGLQLLSMVRACLAQPDRIDAVAEALVATSGRVSGWDDPADVFEIAEVAAKEDSAPRTRKPAKGAAEPRS
ncbi:MAG: hypothetical protein HGA44_14870 [Cellulomonadaceae bacterium]|nr:hypothetical protein [Cellulomonadaceae bacterium]